MKVLFLDIDGVLNNKGSIQRFRTNQTFDPENVKQINRICSETDARIVVSSNWREGNALWVMQGALGHKGITGRIIDLTPDLKALEGMAEDRYQLRVRGIEIQRWLCDNPWVIRHAIVDDRPVTGHDDNFFRTSDDVGITEEIANLVIDHLLEPVKQSP